MAESTKKRKKKEQPSCEEQFVQEDVKAEALDQEAAQTVAEPAEETCADAADSSAENAEPQTEEAVSLQAQLEAATKKQEEYLAMAQRVQADFENFRRRNQNVRKDAFDDGARAFVATLLPVVDNLERALAAAENTSDESLKEGVNMIYRQLCDCFAKRGITTIDRKGEIFDPNLENAVMQGSAEDGEPGTVCEVFQKGYQMEGAVIRHAMVKVVPD